MAKKKKTVFVCQDCGSEHPQWMGKCSVCGAWGTLVEEVVREVKEDDIRQRGNSPKGRATSLKDIGFENQSRIDTGSKELNRVLGGGLVQGSLTLISGEPGIGKSTMIIQVAANLGKTLGNILYVSGEESQEQIKMRSERVCGKGRDNIFVAAETNMENVVALCEEIKPKFLIIDSIQTMYTSSLESAPGSVSQVRACGNILMKIAKTDGIPIFIVAHVTKSGDLAGPKIVEHLVDCVLNFTGERDQELRVLRSYKNRFGTTSEIGAFQMEARGLIEVEDLSSIFIENNEEYTEGSVITAVYEGSRPVFFEVQALTSPANAGFPRRTAVGVDSQRLNIILAVLEKKIGLNLINQDVYVNVVGGVKPDSTSIDLAVALAIYSSLRGISPKEPLVALGEIGLTGDLRSVSNVDKIVLEASRLGYKKILIPKKNSKALDEKKLSPKTQCIGVKNLYQGISGFKGGVD